MEREVGGGIGMGNTCISMADSCQCMTKTTTVLWGGLIKKKKREIERKCFRNRFESVPLHVSVLVAGG